MRPFDAVRPFSLGIAADRGRAGVRTATSTAFSNLSQPSGRRSISEMTVLPNPDPDPIPHPPESSRERRELYQAIGEATTAWAKVEGCLGLIFIGMVAGNAMTISNVLRHTAARAAFHAIVNFNSKLAATNAAARWFLATQPSWPERWNALYNRTKRQAKRRNDIVHYSLIRAWADSFWSIRGLFSS